MRYADEFCTYVEVYTPVHAYIFSGKCVCTGKDYSVTVPAEALHLYRQGEYIQEALKSVSADDREFLISGYSPSGWYFMFHEED